MTRVIIVFKDIADSNIVYSIGGVVVDSLEFIPKLLIADIPSDKLDILKSNSNIENIEIEEFKWTTNGSVSQYSNGSLDMTNWSVDDGISNANPDYVSSNYDKYFIDLNTYRMKGLTGKGVKVGIIDSSGISNRVTNIKAGYVAYDTTHSYLDTWDSHSGACAGLLVGKPYFVWDGSKYVTMTGVAPEADFYYAVGGDPTHGNNVNNTYATQCFNWLISAGVSVISCSWSGSSPDTGLTTAIQTATNNGIAVVFSAGNDGTTDTTLEQILYPSNLSNVISVAGIDETKKRWYTASGNASSTGSQNMFCAPANNVLTYFATNTYSNNSQSTFFTGTSASAPIIAGLIALHKQAFPNKAIADILTDMQSSVWDFGMGGRNKIFGYGLPLPPKSIVSLPNVVSKGLMLDGINTYVTAPASSVLDLRDNFTVEATLISNRGSGGWVFKKVNSSVTQYCYGLYKDYYDQIFYYYNNASGNATMGSPWDYAMSYIDNTPHTFHVVYNYPNIYYYVDGVSKFSGVTLGGHMQGDATQLLKFGSGLFGYLQVARVYNRALSSSEVVNVNSGNRISNGLVLEYIFTGNEVGTVLDTSGSGLNGTINNGGMNGIKKLI